MSTTVGHEQKTAILESWRTMIFQTYPADGARFLNNEKDRFANPVGSVVRQSTEVLLEGLLTEGGEDGPAMAVALDAIIKIRAVQDFAPSQAVSFIFLLKEILREHVPMDLNMLNVRIDRLALVAFDSYMKNREQIHQIKIKEIKSRADRLFARTNTPFDNAPNSTESNGGDGDMSSLKGGAN
jgi:hypothetical protein